MAQKRKRKLSKKPSTHKSSVKSDVKKSTSGVNINVNTKSNIGWRKIITIVICIALGLVLIYPLTHLGIAVAGSLSQLFGIAQQEIDIDAFDGANINSNGGLTKEQIADELSQDNCPTHSDMSDIIYIQDYNDFVCFYKSLTDTDGNKFYPNIVFVKTPDGLKFNGALNMIGSIYFDGAIWNTYIDHIQIYQDYSKVPEYYYNGFKDFLAENGTNLVLLDSNDISFCYGFVNNPWVSLNSIAMQREYKTKVQVLEQTQKYLMSNIINKYFMQFCNNKVDIIQDELTANADFNAFYDYVYRTACTKGYNCMVDVSRIACYPIAPADKTNYPKSDGTYYSVYKCNIMLMTYYNRISTSSKYDGNSSLSNGIATEQITLINEPVNPMFAVSLSLQPADAKWYDNSDIIHSLLISSPVSIMFYDAQNTLYRTTIFDADNCDGGIGRLDTGFNRGIYTYTISSDKLLFSATSGAISITSNSVCTFRYDYQDGLVSTTIKISPASNVDYTTVDFTQNPTKILLCSIDGLHSYTYLYDSIDKVASGITQYVMMGEYHVTILSDVLVFAINSATVTINNNSHNFAYQFAVQGGDVVIDKTISADVTIDYQVQGGIIGGGISGTTTPSANLQIDTTSVTALIDYMGNVISYTLDIDNTTVGTFNYTSGAISLNLNNVANTLTDNTHYTATMTFNNDDKSYSISFDWCYKLGYINVITITIIYE